MAHGIDLRNQGDVREQARRSGVDSDQLTPLLATWQALDAQVRDATQQKQLCAKAFGPAKARGEDLLVLKARMQTLTEELAQIEQQRRAVHSDIEELLARGATATPPTSTPPADRPDVPQAEHTSSRAPPAATNVQFALLTDKDIPDWQAYVTAHPRASLYHDARWRTTIHRAFGHEQTYLMARDAADRLCGVLPMARLRSRLFGDFLISMPFLNYGGALGNSIDIESQLMHEASRLGALMGVNHIEFRDMTQRSGWACRDDKVAMMRALPPTPGELLGQLGAKLRSQIRRPEREGATVELGGRELLDPFYEVFAHNMRDLGTPVYGKPWFASIFTDFGDAVTLSVARIRGRAVGAGFMIRHRQTMEIPWASTLRSANSSGINMLLYWRQLEHAIVSGCTRFDFGRSTRGAGTYRFKQQWGATPVQLHWHYWLAPGRALPGLHPDNPKFKLAIATWQHMPVWLTRLVGPPIVRFLP